MGALHVHNYELHRSPTAWETVYTGVVSLSCGGSDGVRHEPLSSVMTELLVAGVAGGGSTSSPGAAQHWDGTRGHGSRFYHNVTVQDGVCL